MDEYANEPPLCRGCGEEYLLPDLDEPNHGRCYECASHRLEKVEAEFDALKVADARRTVALDEAWQGLTDNGCDHLIPDDHLIIASPDHVTAARELLAKQEADNG